MYELLGTITKTQSPRCGGDTQNSGDEALASGVQDHHELHNLEHMRTCLKKNKKEEEDNYATTTFTTEQKFGVRN